MMRLFLGELKSGSNIVATSAIFEDGLRGETIRGIRTIAWDTLEMWRLTRERQ